MDQPDASKAPAQKNMLMAVLAYIGPLVIVSLLVAKNDPFVKFHIKQGLVLFVSEVVLWFLMTMFFWVIYPIWPLLDLIDLALLILSIIGIVNASQSKEHELPLVGSWGKNFPV